MLRSGGQPISAVLMQGTGIHRHPNKFSVIVQCVRQTDKQTDGRNRQQELPRLIRMLGSTVSMYIVGWVRDRELAHKALEPSSTPPRVCDE